MVWLSDSTSIQADCSGGERGPEAHLWRYWPRHSYFQLPLSCSQPHEGKPHHCTGPVTQKKAEEWPHYSHTHLRSRHTDTCARIIDTHTHAGVHTHTHTHTLVCVRPCWITGQHCFLISINLFSLTQKWPTNLWKAVSALRLSIKTSALCTTQYHTDTRSTTHTVPHSATVSDSTTQTHAVPHIHTQYHWLSLNLSEY